MKRILLLTTLIVSIFVLSGCDQVYIEEDAIGIQFETPEYRGTSLYMLIYLTNGYDSEQYVNNLYISIYTPNDTFKVADAYFVINENIPAGDYLEYELEFFDDSLFYSKEQFSTLNVDLDELVVYFDND